MFQHAASYNGYLTELCQAAHADEADSIGNKLFPAVGVRTAVELTRTGHRQRFPRLPDGPGTG